MTLVLMPSQGIDTLLDKEYLERVRVEFDRFL